MNYIHEIQEMSQNVRLLFYPHTPAYPSTSNISALEERIFM